MANTRELVAKLPHMYAYSQALSSVNVKDISQLKIQRQDVKGELINLHYRMVEKTSVESSRAHSARMFKVYYEDIMREHALNKENAT